MKKQDERRKTKRILVQDIFAVFIVIPNKHGMAKIYLKDLSKGGLRFETELEQNFTANQSLDIRFYTNPSMYWTLQGRVARVEGAEVAIEFAPGQDKQLLAVHRLLDFLEIAAEIAVLN